MKAGDISLNSFVAAAMVVTVSVFLAACSTGTSSRTATSTSGASPVSTTPAMSGMPGMSESMASGDGLAASQSGFTMAPATTTIAAYAPSTFTFTITKPDGSPVTQFVPEQTKLMHFYVIRADLSGFAHLHPTMAADGTWSALLPAMPPGDWRAYTQFTVNRP